MKDLTEFYAVVSGICFTLLGLWWVAVQERPDLRRPDSGGGRTAYVVSLQFLLPGTAALLSQVAPEVSALWRLVFAMAGLAGTAAIVMLAPGLWEGGARTPVGLLLVVGVPLHLGVAVVAAVPGAGAASSLSITDAQLEGVLFCLIVLLSAQVAWLAAMSPTRPVPESEKV